MESKTILGIILIGLGVIFGLYMGVWVCFIGGIVQVIEQIRAEELVAMEVGIGIARVMFAAVIGWLSGIIAILPGVALLDS